MNSFASLPFLSYGDSVPRALDEIGAGSELKSKSLILIKPNLVNASSFPVTTHPDCCEEVLKYIRKHAPDAGVTIAEGCGDAYLNTEDVFSALGYTSLARRYGIKLLDLNEAALVKRSNPKARVFPEIYLPEVAFTHYIVSLPVLKVHTLAIVTGTLKNMMGFAPPRHYSGQYGSWKKAFFHGRMQQSIKDLNRYLKPDLTLMDASVGLSQFHLGGPTLKPPAGRIMAGYDPYHIDREAAKLLGIDPDSVAHLVV